MIDFNSIVFCVNCSLATDTAFESIVNLSISSVYFEIKSVYVASCDSIFSNLDIYSFLIVLRCVDAAPSFHDDGSIPVETELSIFLINVLRITRADLISLFALVKYSSNDPSFSNDDNTLRLSAGEDSANGLDPVTSVGRRNTTSFSHSNSPNIDRATFAVSVIVSPVKSSPSYHNLIILSLLLSSPRLPDFSIIPILLSIRNVNRNLNPGPFRRAISRLLPRGNSSHNANVIISNKLDLPARFGATKPTNPGRPFLSASKSTILLSP